jgi:hypothetical protein
MISHICARSLFADDLGVFFPLFRLLSQSPIMDSSRQRSSSTALSYLGFRNLVLTVFGYFVARVVYQIVYYRYFHPLSKFPGPFWGSVTRLWIA